jgi:SAM-dependent methyltransferase
MFEDYYYLSSVNLGLVRHFETFAQQLAGSRFVIDVGSNDGILLKPLKALGVKALGVEPSVNVSKIANDAGLETLTAFFNSESVQEIERAYGKPDVIVASSVFTHLEDPHQFVDDTRALLSEDGRFIIEVEYIGNILRDIQFERFYLDRIFYYSLTSLKNLFEAHGMYVSDVEHIDPHGGSLRVTVKQGTGTASDAVTSQLSEEATSLTQDTLDAFKRSVETSLAAFKAKLEEYKASGLRVAGYGAPARVATICNYGAIGPELIEFIVDDSPLKQNRFSPGTHIPIVPNAHLEPNRPDVLVVFAYEYFEDIKKKTGGGYRYLIPIPPREIS